MFVHLPAASLYTTHTHTHIHYTRKHLRVAENKKETTSSSLPHHKPRPTPSPPAFSPTCILIPHSFFPVVHPTFLSTTAPTFPHLFLLPAFLSYPSQVSCVLRPLVRYRWPPPDRAEVCDHLRSISDRQLLPDHSSSRLPSHTGQEPDDRSPSSSSSAASPQLPTPLLLPLTLFCSTMRQMARGHIFTHVV